MAGIRIAGTGSCLASREVTSRVLERKIRVEAGWIESRTGIRTRYFCAAGEKNADLAVKASQKAIEAAGLEPKDLDLVIASTLSPDRHFPGIGVDVQARLRCGRIPAIDLNSQCSGFVFGLSAAAAYLASGQCRRVLLVASEAQSPYLEFSNRQKDLCILFGDGAGAVVLEKAPKGEAPFFEMHSDGNFALDLCLERPVRTARSKKHVPNQPAMNKTSVIVHSSRSVTEVIESILKTAGLGLDAVDWLIPHQSNLNLLKEISRRTGFPMSRIVINIDRVGNTSSASIPIALDEAVRAGRVRRGQRVLLVSFGAGYSWGAALFAF